jgi:hypothetical protein
VYRLSERALQPAEIAAELGVSTSGFVSNYRTDLRAILEGEIPRGGTLAPKAASQVRRMLAAAVLSPEAVTYCTDLMRDLNGGTSARTSTSSSGQDARGVLAPRHTTSSPSGPGSAVQPHSAAGSAGDLSPSSAEVSSELSDLVRNDDTRLGQVFRLTEQGLDPEAIAKELGVRTSNFVFNHRVIARALIEGVVPGGDSLKRAAASKARSLLQTPRLTPPTREFLDRLIRTLEPSGSRSDQLPRPARGALRPPSRKAELSLTRLRGMAESLVQRINAETDVDTREYEALAIRPDLPAALSRHGHVGHSKAGTTFLALYERHRLDLTLESFIVRFGRQLGIGEQDRQMAEDRLMYFSELD